MLNYVQKNAQCQVYVGLHTTYMYIYTCTMYLLSRRKRLYVGDFVCMISLLLRKKNLLHTRYSCVTIVCIVVCVGEGGREITKSNIHVQCHVHVYAETTPCY